MCLFIIVYFFLVDEISLFSYVFASSFIFRSFPNSMTGENLKMHIQYILMVINYLICIHDIRNLIRKKEVYKMLL